MEEILRSCKKTSGLQRAIAFLFIRQKEKDDEFPASEFLTFFNRKAKERFPDFIPDKRNTKARDALTALGRSEILKCLRYDKDKKSGWWRVLRPMNDLDLKAFYRKAKEAKRNGVLTNRLSKPLLISKKEKEGANLKQLGSKKTTYKYKGPNPGILEVFENKNPQRDYLITITFPEFTSLCPRTGQPDFATIHIVYIADKFCVESKSLKLYFFAFREYGAFMESITNKVLDDLVSVCKPRWMSVRGEFNPRGAMKIDVTATYGERR